MALKSDGSVVAWGANGFGALGVPVGTQSSVPVGVTGLGAGSGVIAISAGDFHNLARGVSGGGAFSVALKSDGTALAWGRNFEAEAGDGTLDPRPTPVQVTNLTGDVGARSRERTYPGDCPAASPSQRHIA